MWCFELLKTNRKFIFDIPRALRIKLGERKSHGDQTKNALLDRAFFDVWL